MPHSLPFFFFFWASLHSFPPHWKLGHSSLPKRGQVRDLKVGWNFYRQVCLYGYKFHVKNKLKKKQHNYVVVKGVGWWIIKEIYCGGYLSLSLNDDWTTKYLTQYVVVKGVRWWIIKEINCGGYLSLSLIDDWIAKYLIQ